MTMTDYAPNNGVHLRHLCRFIVLRLWCPFLTSHLNHTGRLHNNDARERPGSPDRRSSQLDTGLVRWFSGIRAMGCSQLLYEQLRVGA